MDDPITKKKYNNKYDAELHVAIAKTAASLGAKNVKLAKELGISRSTLVDWTNKYPEFAEAIKKGKDEYDDQLAVDALGKSVKGFYYTETVQEFDGDGKLLREKKFKKYKAPDNASFIFWLKNRQRDKWRDRWEIDGLGDALKNGIKIEIINNNEQTAENSD